MNNKAVINIIIFVGVLVLAIYSGNTFLSVVLKKPIDEIPAIAKFVVHGISLGLIFAFLKKYYAR